MFSERVGVVLIDDCIAKAQRQRLYRQIISHLIDDPVERSVERSPQCNFSVRLMRGAHLVEKEYLLEQCVFIRRKCRAVNNADIVAQAPGDVGQQPRVGGDASALLEGKIKPVIDDAARRLDPVANIGRIRARFRCHCEE